MNTEEYFGGFNQVLTACLNQDNNRQKLADATETLRQTKNQNTKIILIGNGGSAAIAEHMAVDLTKNAKLKAITVSGTPMITTIANDYGYEFIFEKAIDTFGAPNDVLIAISSSGNSKNILNGVKAARAKKMKVITFSGFNSTNNLRSSGDINFWVNSKGYGYVELIHNLLLHYINDSIIGSVEYVIQ